MLSALVIVMSALIVPCTQNALFLDCGECKSYVIDFPGFIPCADGGLGRGREERRSQGQCVIEANGSVVFNETITRKNGMDEGFIINRTTEDWENVTIERKLTFPKLFRNCMSRICLKSSFQTKPDSLSSPAGFVGSLPCKLPDVRMESLSKKQENSFTTIWKKDGRVITNNDTSYRLKPKNGPDFHDLKIKNVSFESSPGNYSCFIEHDGKEVLAIQYRYCVSVGDRSLPKLSTIGAVSSKIRVPPGGSVLLDCIGTEEINVGNSKVTWRKNKNGTLTKICSSTETSTYYFDEEMTNGTKCKKLSLQKGKICDGPPTKKELSDYKASIGRFKAELHIKNAAESDAGEYVCEIVLTPNVYSSNITLIVEEVTKNPSGLKIALAVVFGCLAFFCIIISILKLTKLELQYFIKKHLKDFKISDQPVTYLVYSDDVFQGQDKNPLRDISSWLKDQDYRYYDPNNSDSFRDVGGPVLERSRLAFEKCLSMTVILTPNLLNDNTLELLKSYTGFQDNVTRNFTVIFLCTREMQKEIYRKAKFGNSPVADSEEETSTKVFVTFAHFMKRNTVICWEPDAKTKFSRSLYVALPKVRVAE